MLFETIKEFGNWLDQNSHQLTIKSNLTELVHREGINVR